MHKRFSVSNVARVRRIRFAAMFVLWGFWGASFSTLAAAETITVFAASSLKPFFDDLSPEFTAETGHELVLSYAGSALIARQIQLGAPADVFVSANQIWMDHLVEDGFVDEQSRFDFVRNRLALVAAKPLELAGARADLRTVLASYRHEKIAMGLVQAVPAGQYGKEALDTLGMWQDLEPHIVQLDNVRAALRLVALGELGLGIVYASDAHQNADIDLIGLFSENGHSPILYPAATVAGSEQGEQFLNFLRSDKARARLLKHGFIPVLDERH